MYLRWLAGIVFVLLLGGCKDLLNKPLEGGEDDLSRYVIEGNWVAEDKNTRLELKKADKPGWYQFTVREPDRMVEGKFMAAGFKHKLALSVEMATLRINGEPLVRDDKQAYFLVGAYYSDDELRIAPADMDKFEHNFSDYFFAVPIETAAFCIRGNDNCKKTFTLGNLLVSKNRRKFNEDFVKRFRTIFPRGESIVFAPAS